MNILYIHTHDSGRILSPYGYSVPTPNIEKFAEDAVVFNNAFCVSPTCSPSRAAMLTGTYPHQNGMLGLAQRGFSIDYSKHLVQFLNHHGYHTTLCGIQHEAGWYLDMENNSAVIGYQENISCSNQKYKQEDLVLWDMENAKEVNTWLNSYQSDKPFFLSYGMFATHRPYPDQVDPHIKENFILPPYPIPNNKLTRQDFARYMTSIKWVDACFQVVMDGLKKSGHLEDTIVLFTTDHGLPNPYAKCSLFDSGIAVNLIMRVPGSKTNGMSEEALVSHLDVFPTLCDLLGLKKPEYLEGISFADAFKHNNICIRDEIYAEATFHTSYEPIRCIRTNRYKYIRYYDSEYLSINKSNIDESPTKSYFMDNGLDEQVKDSEALYDLTYDMGERNNLVNNPHYESIKLELKAKLEEHLIKTNDPILAGEYEVQPKWKVNKKECIYGSSKNPGDYISLGE